MSLFKTFLLSACLMALLAFAHRPATIKTDTPEDLAKAVVTSLKNKDQQAFISLLPTKPELTQVLEKPGMTEAQKSALQASIDGFIKKAPDEAGAEFRGTIAQGESAGLNWSKVAYSKCQTEYQNKEGAEAGNMEVTITTAGQSYTITVSNILKTGHGWKTGGRVMYGTPKQHAEQVRKAEQAKIDSIVKRTRDALKASMADTTKK